MQDSAGNAGRARHNHIGAGIGADDDPSSTRVGDSQSSMYLHKSPELDRQSPSSPTPAEFRGRTEITSPIPEDPPEYRIPQRYNETILTLMVRDPYWIYAYWSVSEQDKQRVCRDYGRDAWSKSIKLLRVYDVTDGVLGDIRSRMDIGIGDEATSWYINVPAANRTYCADITIITPTGRELVLARSGLVSTPRDRISDVTDEEWMVLSGFDKLYWMSAGFGPSSPEFQQRFVSRLARRRLLMGSEALVRGFSPSGPWGALSSLEGKSTHVHGVKWTMERGRCDEEIT
ncbi:MAG: DUF4912 domain-containing protein [Bacillota bacterium]